MFLFPNISKDSQCYHAKMPIFVPSSNINCNFLLFFSQFPKGLKCQNLFFPLCCLTLVCFRTARTRMAVATPEELCMAVIAPDVDLAQCVTGAVVVDHPGGPLDRGGGSQMIFFVYVLHFLKVFPFSFFEFCWGNFWTNNDSSFCFQISQPPEILLVCCLFS